MTIKTSKKMFIDNRLFDGADKVGFTEDGYFVLHLHTFRPESNDKANYHTCLAISPMSYRKRCQTKAAVKDCGEYIQVYDDWGSPIKIMSSREVLEGILKECKDNLLPLLDD